MGELFAIRGPRNRPEEPPAETTTPTPTNPNDGGAPADDSAGSRLLKLIPGEAITFYSGALASLDQLYERKLIPDRDTYFWTLVGAFVLALILLLVIRFVMSKDPKTGTTQWQPVAITVVSFLIYAYTIGGPFQHCAKIGSGWLGAVGLIVASFWTTISPYLFKAG